MLRLLTITSLLLPGVGEEGFTHIAMLAQKWARGNGDKGHPNAMLQLELQDDICPKRGAYK